MRLIGIPPDISYGLQCSVECFDITQDVMTFYYRFNETVDLAHRVDNDHHGHDDRANSISESLRRSAMRNYYAPYNEWFWKSANPDERAWCLASATETSARCSAESIDSLLNHYVSEALVNDLDPAKRCYQEQWLSRSRNFLHCARIMQQAGKKIDSVSPENILEALMRPDSFTARLRQPDMSDFDAAQEMSIWRDPIPQPSIAEQRRIKKQKRKIVAKSASFLSRLMGQDNTTMFLGGQRIEVEGERFIFSIKKQNIFGDSHGALSIQVNERQSQDRLFDLCWYVDATPAMDQVAAMVLAVQCGDEDEIVRVGNAFRVNHEAIERHQHLHDVVSCPNLPNLNFLIDERDPMDHPLMPGVDRDTADDRLFHHTPGTTRYIRNNAGVYRDFSRRASLRMMRGFDNAFRDVFMPHSPEFIRPIAGNTVGRELLRVETRQHDLDELTRLLA